MTDPVADELLRWLQGARESFETEAPRMASELLRWSFASDLVGLGVTAALLVVARWCYRAAMDSASDDGFGYGIACFICAAVGGLVGVIALIDLTGVVCAPHWYVLSTVLEKARGK